jgi:hypothetical protein
LLEIVAAADGSDDLSTVQEALDQAAAAWSGANAGLGW